MPLAHDLDRAAVEVLIPAGAAVGIEHPWSRVP
jgi:hypothetical protein